MAKQEYGEVWRGEKGWVVFFPATYRCRDHFQGYVPVGESNRRVGQEGVGFPSKEDAINAITNAA